MCLSMKDDEQDPENTDGTETNETEKKSLLSYLYNGFRPKYVWQDGEIGSHMMITPDGSAEESWMQLFFDLLYVGLMSRLSHTLLGW